MPFEKYQLAEIGRPLNLSEPAEIALFEIGQRGPVIDRAVETGEGYRAFAEAAKFKPVVDSFSDVLVMSPDLDVREARLRLMRRLEGQIVKLADISEIVAEDTKSG